MACHKFSSLNDSTPVSHASRRWKLAIRRCRWTSWSVPCCSSEPALPILPTPFEEERREPVLAPPKARLSCSCGLSALSCFSGGVSDLVNKTDQIDERDRPRDSSIHHSSIRSPSWKAGCFRASLTDLPKQETGDRVRFAPSPLVAPLPRRGGRDEG